LTATRAQTPVIPATCTEWFDGASFVVQRTTTTSACAHSPDKPPPHPPFRLPLVFAGCNTCFVHPGLSGSCGNVKACGDQADSCVLAAPSCPPSVDGSSPDSPPLHRPSHIARPSDRPSARPRFCQRYADGTTCVASGSCTDVAGHPVPDSSGGSPTVLTSAEMPIGLQSCAECIADGRFYGAGICAAAWSDLDVDGAICSNTHGLAHGEECCDALAGGGSYSPGGAMSGLSSISVVGTVSFGGCDLEQLSMKCADVNPTASTFCSSMCRQMAMEMADDCSREGISIAADALSSNPCLR
jgi:hypothetical protein